ncbi:MAG TPA: hypothetical protein P5204_09405 [Kiritimatiellia bacterium]|nr:hypothetical protein [Kiritimatiellia bacterium]
MMSLRKMLWVATALGVLAGAAWADPMRTVFTKENKFPGALKPELSLAGGGSSFDPADSTEDVERYFVAPGVRFGLTDRLTLLATVPYAGYSDETLDESGLGDVEIGTEFLFYEDIFEYAWIIPHATAILSTGDEDKGLGAGEGQGRFGISVGTTMHDVLHWAVDASYTLNGAAPEDPDFDDSREDLFAGALSLIWDLDERSSVLGEVQVRDDPVDPEDDYALRGHLGLAYRINKTFSIMGYLGGSDGLAEDYYGMGRLVAQF